MYTAKFVSYNDEEDEDTTGLAGQVKLSSTRKSYGDLPPAHKPQPPARKPRPMSDGIFLSSSFQPPAVNANSTAGQPPPPPIKPSLIPTGNFKGRHRKERGHASRIPPTPYLSFSRSCFLCYIFVFLFFQYRGVLASISPSPFLPLYFSIDNPIDLYCSCQSTCNLFFLPSVCVIVCCPLFWGNFHSTTSKSGSIFV